MKPNLNVNTVRLRNGAGEKGKRMDELKMGDKVKVLSGGRKGEIGIIDSNSDEATAIGPLRRVRFLDNSGNGLIKPELLKKIA